MAQLIIEGISTVNADTPTWLGVNIPRSEDTDLIYRRNHISSINTQGYMLQAGDENVGANNNNLDGAIIQGNKLVWGGTPSLSIITHGIFTGYNINAVIKYNYLDGVPMGIIRKSNGMTDTTGVVAYNIIKNGKPGIVVKGMNGVRIYNNTLYSSLTSAVCNRALVEVYDNDNPVATSAGAKIKNNIFYTVYKGINSIWLGNTGCIGGFECDYNIYWCEEGDHLPTFNYLGSVYTWAQWRALGYDAHSIVVNPNFFDTTKFVPQARLDYGTNLGTVATIGLNISATWDLNRDITHQLQLGTWQVGARIYGTATDIGGDYYLANWGSDTLGNGSFNNPWFSLTRLWSAVSAGATCYMRGGTYNYSSAQILTGKNGTSANYIRVLAYPNETPNLSKTPTFTYPGWPATLIRVTGSYIHFRGWEISYAEQTTTNNLGGFTGYFLHNSIIELFNVHHCGGGLQLLSAGDNLILNSDFHHNYDPYDRAHPYPDPLYDPYGDADGLGIQDDGYGTETIVRGCRFWCNSDDGIDLWYSSKKVTLDGCWSFWNGYSDNGITPYDDPLTVGYDGDGNGFKLGPCVPPPYTGHELEQLRTVKNCLASHNRAGGFNMNATYCRIKLFNNVSCFNQQAGFLYFDWGTAINEVKNNISYGNISGNSQFKATDILDHNTFLYTGAYNTAYYITAADFKSIDPTGLDGPRQADGSKPLLDFLHLSETSDLRNGGVSLGGENDYDGDGFGWNILPSLGSFEFIGEQGVGVRKQTTVLHSVPSTPIFVRDIPDWLTVWNDNDGVRVYSGDSIASGTTLSLYPNSMNNIGATRDADILLEDNTPSEDSYILRVSQRGNINPVVVVFVIDGEVHEMEITNTAGNNIAGYTYVTFQFFIMHPDYGSGGSFPLQYEFLKNGISNGTGTMDVYNYSLINTGDHMATPSAPGDQIVILLWENPKPT